MIQKQNTQLINLSNLLTEAREVFNSKEKADLWFDTPNQALSGDRPKSRIVTENGLQQVHDLIMCSSSDLI